MPTNEPVNQAPIACTLSAADLSPRLARIRALTAAHLRAHELAGSRLRLLYAAEAAEEVAQIVELERRCCAFLDFHLAHLDDGVELIVVGPEQEGSDAQWLFSQFLPEAPAPVAACACCKG